MYGRTRIGLPLGRPSGPPRPGAPAGRGWTLVEVVAVIVLAGVLAVVALISVYRGQAMSQELACQDNMQAIHSALQIHWEKNNRTYPADQAAFTQFLQSPAYFPDGELHCPRDANQTSHYQYSYASSPSPVPGDITLTCPVAGSGHGSVRP